MNIGVISDTHTTPSARPLPKTLEDVFAHVDLIVHAGDLIDPLVLDELSSYAPVRAVLGNCDPWDLSDKIPDRDLFEADGIKIGVIHDSGATLGRGERMKQLFPECRVVIFGHSHRPLIQDDGELMLLNPGSACDPRSAKIPTVAILEVLDRRVVAKLIELPR